MLPWKTGIAKNEFVATPVNGAQGSRLEDGGPGNTTFALTLPTATMRPLAMATLLV